MQNDKNYFAIVSDSNGRLTGIVTLEDIIEEIVGDIEEDMVHNSPGEIR